MKATDDVDTALAAEADVVAYFANADLSWSTRWLGRTLRFITP